KGATLNSTTWTIIINAIGQGGDYELAQQLFDEIPPPLLDEYCWGSILSAAGKSGDLHTLQTLHSRLLSSGQPITTELWNSLISAYGKCGSTEHSLQLFNEIPSEKVDEFSWRSILAAAAAKGDASLVQELHSRLLSGNFHITTNLWNGIISAYGKCGLYQDV